MATTSLHPTAVQETIVYKDDSDGTRVVLERTPMPIEQYLRNMYHPDRDYADGCAEQRNVGEYEHGKVGFRLAQLLDGHSREWKIDVVPECRLQVTPNRFRVPDILVLRQGVTARPYPTTAPLICVEVLSPEDTWARTRVRLDDYRLMGVENIWILEPVTRSAFVYDESGYRNVAVFAVAGTGIAVQVADIFSQFDEA